MKEETRKRTRTRVLWIAVLLAVIFFSAGGYFWYEQVNVKYDRITNARRV
jgi:hypothetical protein